MPKPRTREKLWKLVSETANSGLAIDVRCTDTGSTPNSVLLIGSNGNLYTEGFAHHGKVELYDAQQSRPDRVLAMWSHIDRFGHACRYLNWNPWYYGGERNLRDICYSVPHLPSREARQATARRLVETEVKRPVVDVQQVRTLLREQGFSMVSEVTQRDEYFDTSNGALAQFDYVLRLRNEGETWRLAFKGPRVYTQAGEYSRLELEFRVGTGDELKGDLLSKGLRRTWYFEKRRASYRQDGREVVAAIDEIPDVGFFLEIEGRPSDIASVLAWLSPVLGKPDTRNYKDIYLDYKRQQGMEPDEVGGAAFRFPGGETSG